MKAARPRRAARCGAARARAAGLRRKAEGGPAAAFSRGWDAEVGIVGAGPAGARAAELLAEFGAEVIAFDGRAPWEKACGGGLPAAAYRNVPELAEVKTFSRAIRKMRIATIDGAAILVPFREPLYVVSRKDLGAWQLARARRSGARLVHHAVAVEESLGVGWRLRDAEGREYRVLRLVGADGAASRVRRLVAAGFHPELAPTRVAYPQSLPPFPADQVLFAFFSGVTGYLWDFPRPGHRSVGVALAPGTWTRKRMDGALARYLENGGRGDGADPAGAAIATALWLRGDSWPIGGTHWALLGDAAGLADPATGEGIENALRSAGFLAESYERRRDFALYPRITRSALLPEFRVARMIRRCLYYPRVPQRIIGAALRWSPARRFVRSLVDCTNEHRGPLSLIAGLLRRLPEAEAFHAMAGSADRWAWSG